MAVNSLNLTDLDPHTIDIGGATRIYVRVFATYPVNVHVEGVHAAGEFVVFRSEDHREFEVNGVRGGIQSITVQATDATHFQTPVVEWGALRR